MKSCRTTLSDKFIYSGPAVAWAVWYTVFHPVQACRVFRMYGGPAAALSFGYRVHPVQAPLIGSMPPRH